MAQSSEVQALEKISTEVDESQIKVILSTQCIKAQKFLVDKLRKQAERSKETCGYLSSANFQLQSENEQAQREITSLLLAQETIKLANVELKKEWLLAKEKKLEIIERVHMGETKYEKLWLETKARYESLPFVQNLMKTKDEVENLKQQITKLENEEKRLTAEIKIKKETCLNLDRKRIIELADFIVNEIPKRMKLINEKSAAIRELSNELDNLGLKVKENTETEEATKSKDDLKTDNDRSSADIVKDTSIIMPKLHLDYLDLDVLSVNQDQVKVKNVDHFNITSEKYNINAKTLGIDADARKVNKKAENIEEYISSFLNKPCNVYEENRPQNYAKMKLINILEDIKVDKNEAQKMIAEVNPDALQSVDSISADGKNVDKTCEASNNEVEKHLESEVIEEIDLTNSNTELLVPPTQFLDKTTEVKVSHMEPYTEITITGSTSEGRRNNSSQNLEEVHCTKKVSFNLSNTSEMNITNDVENRETADKMEVNETVDSQLNISAVSDDGFAKMKDMIMKRHNLDLSPQFVYAKNIIAPLNLQKPEEEVVTSKFFQQNQNISDNREIEVTSKENQVMDINEAVAPPEENNNKLANQSKIKSPVVEMDIDADVVSNPKRQKICQLVQSDKPASGFLFSRGGHTIPDSLDNSISTTGFEDIDADFPHCIDSSLLLSPKADFPMSTGEVKSQDVPNFLSGLRKTGLSFFGGLTSTEPKPESSAPNQGSTGFSFSFDGKEKKSKGGFFSMF